MMIQLEKCSNERQIVENKSFKMKHDRIKKKNQHYLKLEQVFPHFVQTFKTLLWTIQIHKEGKVNETQEGG